jgi:hypothetical protein
MKFRKKWAGKWDLASSPSELSLLLLVHAHRRTGRKKLGGRKEICPTFSDCARVVKKNFPEKLSKIVVDGGGGVITKNSY